MTELSRYELGAVLIVLRKALCRGLPETESCSSSFTGLTRWQRFINWLSARVGGTQPPFVDPCNYSKVDVKPVSMFVNQSILENALKKLSPEPECHRCGGTNLAPDPAGYYTDAQRWDGASLLCLEHDD